MWAISNPVSSELGWSKLMLARWDWGELAQVFVVGIVRQAGDMLSANPFHNDICDGSLSGARSASNGNDNGGCKRGHTGIILEEFENRDDQQNKKQYPEDTAT